MLEEEIALLVGQVGGIQVICYFGYFNQKLCKPAALICCACCIIFIQSASACLLRALLQQCGSELVHKN